MSNIVYLQIFLRIDRIIAVIIVGQLLCRTWLEHEYQEAANQHLDANDQKKKERESLAYLFENTKKAKHIRHHLDIFCYKLYI